MSERERKRRSAQRARSHEARSHPNRKYEAGSTDALGWRINQFAAMAGISRITVWRLHRDGKLKIIYLDKIPMIPRTEAVRLGFINA